jgi:hypothetical protein
MMDIKRVVTVFGLALVSNYATAKIVSGHEYSIESQYKLDIPAGSCLRTNSSNSNVAVDACDGPGYSTMKKWILVATGDGTYQIKSHYKQDAGQGSCLRIDARNHVSVGDCNGAGYSTMKKWLVTEVGNGTYELKNKYNLDTSKPSMSCLRTSRQSKDATIGKCYATGAGDYSTMRKWVIKDSTPITPGGMVSVNYKVKTTKQALTEISFPFTVHSAPDASGYYFAQQYSFINGSTGYIGIRPRPNGKSLAAFSIWGNSEIIDTQRCYYGADGEKGLSCSASHDLVHGRKYVMTISRDQANDRIYHGTVTDSVSGKMTPIGSYKTPRTWTLKSKYLGFIEYYKRISSCENVPYADVSFYPPLDENNIVGLITGYKHYGRCKDRVNFNTQVSNDTTRSFQTGR